MKFLKIFTLILPILFISFTASAEIIKFSACVYDGDVDDKGRADGNGVCEFNDGNVFNGTFKKNKFIKGKFIDNENNIFYEGKIKWGTFYVYLDGKKVRLNNKVSLETGLKSMIEMKKMSQWFEAEKINGFYELTKKGEMEFQQAQSGGGDGGGDGGGGGGGGGC
jgi:uncharacterized membrane protein YgcG